MCEVNNNITNCFISQYQDCVRPQMFRTLVGRGHQEFATKRQQDAQEYLLHLFTLIEVYFTTLL